MIWDMIRNMNCKFEYTALVFNSDPKTEQNPFLTEELNKLGELRWELVAFDSATWTAIFKRPVISEDDRGVIMR